LTHETSNLYKMTLNSNLTTIGMLYEDTDHVYDTMHDLVGMDVGARMAPMYIGPLFAHVGYNRSTTPSPPAGPFDSSVVAQLLTTCVPLTLREELTESKMSSMVANSLVYRRRPVDCAMLGKKCVAR